MRLRAQITRFRRDVRGVAAVEFALALPFLALTVFGAVDAAWLIHQSHRVEQGLELAGNYLAQAQNPQERGATAANIAVTGEPAGGTARVEGWTPGDVRITFRDEAGNYRNGGRVVALSSQHTYRGFGLLRGVFRGTLSVKGRHEVRLG